MCFLVVKIDLPTSQGSLRHTRRGRWKKTRRVPTTNATFRVGFRCFFFLRSRLVCHTELQGVNILTGPAVCLKCLRGTFLGVFMASCWRAVFLHPSLRATSCDRTVLEFCLHRDNSENILQKCVYSLKTTTQILNTDAIRGGWTNPRHKLHVLVGCDA